MRLDRARGANGFEHRPTKPGNPWTNGQVDRMNQTIKGATARCFHDDSHDPLRMHRTDLMDAWNYARRSKTLNGLTSREQACKKSGRRRQIESSQIRSTNCRD